MSSQTNKNNLFLELYKEDYIKYKEELEKIIKIKEDEFLPLLEIIKSINQKKIQSSFFLFFQYKQWIFPYIEINNIISNNTFTFGSKFIYIFNKLKQNKISFDEKSFILWYLYLFFTFYNEEKRNKQIIINLYRYFLLETNKIVSSLYESKKLLINNIINFLDIYLITLKNYVNSAGYFKISPKMQKIKKMFIFKNFFALLEKISIFSIKSKNYKDFEIILKYLTRIINNSLLNDEINIIIIDSNNIIQSFINNLLNSLNNIEIEKELPTYRKDLIIFYNHFLIYKYKTSNIFSNCIDMLRKSYEHLYYFIPNKFIIIKDIFINNFYSHLLSELLKKEKEKKKIKNEQYPLESSFLFDHKSSIISFMHEKIQLDKNILFFSFQIGKIDNTLNINNREFTLILIKYKNKNINYDIFLRIYLTKVEGTEKYSLCISQPENNVINVVNPEPDYFIIDNNNIYYAAIYLNEKKLKVYLYHDTIKKTTNNNIYKEFNFHPMKKETKIKVIIGSDEINSFYKGKIGPIIMIKAPTKDNIISKVIDTLISNILLLKDKYKDFLIIKSDLSKNYNFNLKDYYELKEFYDNYEIKEKINEDKREIKGTFDCLLYLSPNIFNHLDNKIINESDEPNLSKALPTIPNLCNKNGEYILLELNVTVIDFERNNKLFGMDNCLDYSCLQIEYYNQFAQYYLIKSNRNKNIYSKKELETIIKEIINGIKENILLMGYHNQSKYLYKSYKKIFLLLYNCLLNLNTIRPIIKDFFEQLLLLKDIYRGIILNFRNSSIDEIELKNDEYVHIQNDKQFDSKIVIDNKNNYNSFLHTIISYYIGIIEILLNINFYNISEKQNNIELIRQLFKNLIDRRIKFSEDNDNDNDNNKENFIYINYFENIFYKLLKMISLLDRYFKKKDMIIIDKDEKKTFIELLKLNFQLLINILNDKNEKKSNELFHKIFRFVLSNNRFNYYILYSYLDTLYNSSIENYFLILEENEINYLQNLLFELVNKNIEQDLKEDIQIHLISILYDFIFFNPRKKVSINFNFIEKYFKNNDISKNLLIRIKDIIEKYLLNNLIKNNIKNSIIKELDSQELMKYTWDLFEFLIIILKKIKSNTSKITDNNLINNNIYEVVGIFKVIELEIKESLNLNKLNQFIILYLINFTRFLYFAINDDELNSLYNHQFFLKIIDGHFNICFESTLFHSNNYFIINENNNSDNKEAKKLISQAFFEINEIHLEQIFLKYSNENNNEEISDDDLYFIDNFSKGIEKTFLQEFNSSNYSIKKTSNYDNKNTIFFLSDFLKLLLSEKKYFKKYEKNKDLSTMINYYKGMKEIILNIDKNYKESNNIFEFYFTTYYFYKVFQLIKTIDYYLKNEQIKKYKKLIDGLKNLKSELYSFEIIALDDHLKLNQIIKDYYFKKFQTNDIVLKNVLKIIQNSIFNKKNKEKKDLVEIFNEMNKEFLLIEDKTERNSCFKIRSKMLDNISKEVQEPLKKMNTFESYQIIENNTIIMDKEKQDKKEETSNGINGQNDKNNNNLVINYTDTIATSDISLNNIINDVEIENEKKEKEKEDEKIIYNVPLLELSSDIFSKNIFDEINKELIINPKKELMNKIFGVYFEESFFNNKTFKKLKNYYLNLYENIFPESKLLNFPSKIKNFTNGIETPLFLKENDKFFITKTFPITHEYFYNYMIENKIKNESIILLKNNSALSFYNISNNEEEMKEFDCELVKLNKTYYGNIINSVEGGFFIFKEKEYNINDNANNFKEELQKKVFTLSALDIVSTDNSKLAKKEATNAFLDDDIFPEEEINNNKNLIIFYSDIEEIIERRFLYLWQGLEIFLKNGKSYIFNMTTFDNYNNFIKHLKKIENAIFREKDFFTKTAYISDNWRNQKLSTYNYLLLINKYGSRSLNDSTQYYVFPWILKNFTNLITLNDKEPEIYEAFLKIKEEKFEKLELDKIEETPKGDANEKLKYLNDFRKLKYPVSVQAISNREYKIAKFNDADESFSHHHGTHYSTSSYIFYYLMRLEPFTTLLIELQNYTQENPDRMMQDLKDTIKIINSGNDNRELVPEFFSKIEFFVNVNCVFFGRKKNNRIVDDLLQMFDINNDIYYNNLAVYVKFIIEHKKLLNSKAIAININSWIDNVFGVGQLPPYRKREYSYNIFGKTCYEEETDLHDKLDRLFEKGYDKKKIKKKIANRINLILSFGQTPQQIFFEKHKGKSLTYTQKNSDVAEEIPENYGHQDDYLGDDFVLNFIMNESKKEDNEYSIKIYGIFFEINPLIEKIFILNESSELLILDSNFYNLDEQNFYLTKDFGKYKLPNICLFDKLKIKNNNYYIYNIKYSFSSFPIDIKENSNNPIPYLYSNQYIRNSKSKSDDEKIEVDIEAFKFITCRHLDNSFKIHCIPNIKKPKDLETYSYICEDFVMSCKAISSNSFILGLKNGKLIKALINESENENEKENKHQKNKKKKENENNENDDKYKITFENYIQGHKGSINMIEIDEKVGVVITSGDDNKVYIRKLYDFELLTCITIKSKFIISFAKISPMNFLYIMCYNKQREQFIIFGYTLSGLKFAKSSYAYYTNFDFTENGNIICLVNENELGILSANNLNSIKINKSDNDYEKYEQVKNCIKNGRWIQFDNFEKYYGVERKVISYLSANLAAKNKFYFKTLKASNISYFQ